MDMKQKQAEQIKHRVKKAENLGGNAGFLPLLLTDQVQKLKQLRLTRLNTSDDLLSSIQQKIKWANTMDEVYKKHTKEIDGRVEVVKKILNKYTVSRQTWSYRGHDEFYSEPGRVMDYKEVRSRPKR